MPFDENSINFKSDASGSQSERFGRDGKNQGGTEENWGRGAIIG